MKGPVDFDVATRARAFCVVCKVNLNGSPDPDTEAEEHTAKTSHTTFYTSVHSVLGDVEEKR